MLLLLLFGSNDGFQILLPALLDITAARRGDAAGDLLGLVDGSFFKAVAAIHDEIRILVGQKMDGKVEDCGRRARPAQENSAGVSRQHAAAPVQPPAVVFLRPSAGQAWAGQSVSRAMTAVFTTLRRSSITGLASGMTTWTSPMHCAVGAAEHLWAALPPAHLINFSRASPGQLQLKPARRRRDRNRRGARGNGIILSRRASNTIEST